MKTGHNRLFYLALILVIGIAALGLFTVGAGAEGDPEDGRPSRFIQWLYRRWMLRRMIEQSDLIALTQVAYLNSYTIDNDWGTGLIASNVAIAREETLKGSEEGPIQFLGTLGGVRNGIGFMPENYPHFPKAGERNLLFLKRQTDPGALKAGNAWQVLDGAAGKMRLDAEGNVIPLGMSWADVRIELISWLRGARLYLPLLMRNSIINPQQTLAPPSAELAYGLLYDNYDISWPGASPVVNWKLYNPGFNDALAGTVTQQNDAIQAGAREWELRGRANFKFVYDGTTTINKSQNDGVNVLLVLPLSDPVAIAACAPRYDANTLAYLDFDVVYYDTNHVFDINGASGYDIQGITTHELGHAAAIDHSAVNGATEWPYADHNGLYARTLHLDDIDAITSKYGERYSTYDQTGAGTNETGDRFGSALAAGDFDNDGDDDLAVGAYWENTVAEDNGVVFVFPGRSGFRALGTPIVLDQTGASPNEAGDNFGYALATGDFNHDFEQDLIVSAPGEDGSAGRIFLFNGSPQGLTQNPVMYGQAPVGADEAGDKFGWSLAVGDFNHDHLDDIAIGIPYEDYGSATDCGGVIVYYGSATGLYLPQFLHQELVPNAANENNDLFGWSVATGDLNGDGYDDLLIGAPWEDTNATDNGLVFVFYGSSGGLGNGSYFDQDTWPGTTNETGDRFGYALAVGDFDGNGHRDDIAVGVPYETQAGQYDGVVCVEMRNNGVVTYRQVLDQAPAGGNEAGDRFGQVLAIGDINADGTDELLIGVPGEDTSGKTDNGVVFVQQFYSDWSNDAPYKMYIKQPNGAEGNSDAFGSAICTGEFNGSAGDDVVVGAPNRSVGGQTQSGLIYVWW
jgi:hypothetical protein